MKKQLFLFVFALITFSCKGQQTKKTEAAIIDLIQQEKKVTQLLDKWHANAAQPNFEAYFEAMDENSVFIGTDATEIWNKKEFMAYAKPHFDKGKAWSFTALQRNIYFSDDNKTAWFDELLNTQMKLCRGSGVLVLTKNGWKIKQYVLSMTIPNDNADAVIKAKTTLENKEIEKIVLINEHKKN